MLKSLVTAFSMYSKIPMPRVEWSEKNMRYALSLFPLVGLVIGVLVFCWMFLCQRFFENKILQTLPLLILPLLVTGGIHADGFLDTSDALSSYKSREEKLLILKDPHVGSFAVIKFLLLCLIYLSAVSLFLFDKIFCSWCLTFMLSRIFSAFAAVNFKGAKEGGTLYAFSNSAAKKITNCILFFEALVAATVVVFLSPLCAVVIFIALILHFIYFRFMAVKKFGGLTGDLCGWFVCTAETVCAVCLAILCALEVKC